MKLELNAWLSHLEKLHPKTIDLGLTRVAEVAKRLNLLPVTIPVITVSGTNGKGSTVAALESIYRAAGYRTGLYTSPHLLHFNERALISGEMLPDAAWVSAFEKIEVARQDISITYFEFATLAALVLFAEAKIDIMILEVGMGGRLDAVNIVDADVAVITQVALDHQDYLGPDRESIAFEKAGILRAGKPVVFGEQDIPQAILKAAREKAAPLFIVKEPKTTNAREVIFEVANLEQQVEFLTMPMPSLAFINTAIALQAIALLQTRRPVSVDAMKAGISHVRWRGRFECHLHNDVMHVLDVAHNPAAFSFLAKQLQAQPCSGSTYVVLGMFADKDIAESIRALNIPVKAWYLGAITDDARAATTQQLAEKFCTVHPHAQYTEYADIFSAWEAATHHAQSGDRIIVCGSFHTVAPILALDCFGAKR